MYGLQGYVDITVEANILSEHGVHETIIAPLELKSGDFYHTQESQVHHYALLMNDKYSKNEFLHRSFLFCS